MGERIAKTRTLFTVPRSLGVIVAQALTFPVPILGIAGALVQPSSRRLLLGEGGRDLDDLVDQQPGRGGTRAIAYEVDAVIRL